MNGLKMRLGIIFAVMVVAGVMLIIDYSKDSFAMSKGMPDFNTMKMSDFEEGRFVQGTIYELYDEFAYMEETSSTFGIKTSERVTAHYYVMPLYSSYDLDYPQYVAVCLRNANMVAAAETIIDETWAYYEDGVELDNWTELPITGKVSRMSGELLDYFYEWVMYGEESTNRSDFSKNVVPYVITYYEPSAMSSGLTVGVVLLVIGIAGAAVMIAGAVKAKRRPEASFSPTVMPSYPVSPASTQSTDYSPVSSPASSDQFTSQTAPVSADSTPTSMDELDTSALGIGIDDGGSPTDEL